ncbi:VOC family protein [Rhodocytophaga rosea]|uniref:VOC family protein n=1 Tax=Rhodocytophaga rosea TaxID=2704465 RepID=A0A6C0GJZ9_9BACT|nr:VOC family protein [Rhodocytophaga rosea]QHT68401.1 VOC family protein [Rhodocytophaga rosea]
MQLAKIHHIAIICSDYERSKKFYTEVLGLPVIHETFRAERNSYKLDLAVGNQAQIELFSFPDTPERISRPEARGLRHLAFQVENIDATVQELEAHQVSCEPIRVDDITGKRFTFFTDPDGLPLELYEA